MENSFTRSLERRLRSSLTKHVSSGASVLLGYSGGPDSEALLQLFVNSRLIQEYPLHLVHVDHSWREESRDEAELLRKKAESLGCPFHLFRLNPDLAMGNLENWSRDQRQEVFSTVGKNVGASWLLLGHHKDDSTEVSFKRLMEGSHLIYAAGIQETYQLGNLTVLRPLLHCTKEELLSYLHMKGVDWLHDPTNTDTRFLRSSLRHELFPFLSEAFHKNIRSSLTHIASEASLLDTHVQCELNKKCTWIQDRDAIFCAPDPDLSDFLLLQAIHEGCRKLRVSLSREQEMKAMEVLARNGKSIELLAKNISLYIDSRCFVMIYGQKLLDLPLEYVIEKEGVYSVGSFQVSVSKEPPLPQKNSFFGLFHEGFCFEVAHLPLVVIPANERNIRSFVPKQNGFVFQLPSSIRRTTPLFIQGNRCLAAPFRGWKKNIQPSGETIFVTVIRLGTVQEKTGHLGERDL